MGYRRPARYKGSAIPLILRALTNGRGTVEKYPACLDPSLRSRLLLNGLVSVSRSGLAERQRRDHEQAE